MTTCIVCESSAHIVSYGTAEGVEYLRCKECGLVFVGKTAPTDILYRSYDGGTLKSVRRKIFAPFRRFQGYRNFRRHMARGAHIVGTISGRLPTNISHPTILDIGANKGFLLANAIARGWIPYGIEIVPELMVPFRREYPFFGDNIYSGRFCDLYRNFSDGQFDMVSAIDVIEHLEDPISDLRQIFRILKPDGIFVLQTPNASGSESRRDGIDWKALRPFEHLFLFDPNNLGKLLSRIGFRDFQQIPEFDTADGNFAAIVTR